LFVEGYLGPVTIILLDTPTSNVPKNSTGCKSWMVHFICTLYFNLAYASSNYLFTYSDSLKSTLIEFERLNLFKAIRFTATLRSIRYCMGI
jgi:hypothetical protein